MSNYKTITSLLREEKNLVQETLLVPLKSLEKTTKTISEFNPTESNEAAKQKLQNITEKLHACLTLHDPLKLFIHK